MFIIYADGEVLHNPKLDRSGKIVINPVLTECINTIGSLEFSIAPTNPLYNSLEVRNTKIKVISDQNNAEPWFGRVMEIQQDWNNCLTVYCEGALGCLNDAIQRPFGFTGTITDLLAMFIATYTGATTRGYNFAIGTVTVTDPNNNIVRSSSYAKPVWECIDEKLFNSSLGGFISTRYDSANDTILIDYLAPGTSATPPTPAWSGTVKFGRNLLDFARTVNADNVITVLIPYGAQLDQSNPDYEAGPPANGLWNGNRLTIRSVNNNKNYIENNTGKQLWGRIVGTKIWQDVTIAQNLKDKAEAWLANQIEKSISIELTAFDLTLLGHPGLQMQIGKNVLVQSEPHGINISLVCSEKRTYLTNLEESTVTIGTLQPGLSDLYEGGSENES